MWAIFIRTRTTTCVDCWAELPSPGEKLTDRQTLSLQENDENVIAVLILAARLLMFLAAGCASHRKSYCTNCESDAISPFWFVLKAKGGIPVDMQNSYYSKNTPRRKRLNELKEVSPCFFDSSVDIIWFRWWSWSSWPYWGQVCWFVIDSEASTHTHTRWIKEQTFF